VNNQVSRIDVRESWVPLQAWWPSSFQRQPIALPKRPRGIRDVPSMAATVLGLDLLLQEPTIDLSMASELVLSDVGATLQVLQLVGSEYMATEECLSRMDQCLAGLDVNVWFGRISAHTFANNQEHVKTTAIWKHCRLIAQYAQLVAETLDNVSPEQAYLVGLLHEIEVIPETLGWKTGSGTLDLPAMHGVLPPFVHAALVSLQEEDLSIWKFILRASHDLAKNDSDSSMLAGGCMTDSTSA
jgi:HDOD domain